MLKIDNIPYNCPYPNCNFTLKYKPDNKTEFDYIKLVECDEYLYHSFKLTQSYDDSLDLLNNYRYHNHYTLRFNRTNGEICSEHFWINENILVSYKKLYQKTYKVYFSSKEKDIELFSIDYNVRQEGLQSLISKVHKRAVKLITFM